MYKYIRVLAIGIMAAMFFISCDGTPTEYDDYSSEAVLHCYLSPDSSFGKVRLGRVWKTIENEYVSSDNGIIDADIRIEEIAIYDSTINGFVDIDGGAIVEYGYDDGNRYTAIDQSEIVKTLTLYKIEVRFAGTPATSEPDIWAETMTPDFFTVTSSNYPNLLADNVPATVNDYPVLTRDHDMIRTDWTNAWPSDLVGYDVDNGGGWILAITALSDLDDIEPLDPDWDPIEDPLEPEDKQNRTNWTIATNYQNGMSVPWVFFNFVGPTRIDVIAGSHEYYRYAFSTPVGPFTEIELESNIEGGLGCFGGYIRHSFYVNMERVEL